MAGDSQPEWWGRYGFTDSFTDSGLRTDGGVEKQRLSTEQLGEYSDRLRGLTELEDEILEGGGHVADSQVASTIEAFLETPYAGSAYRTGLRIAVLLVVESGVTDVEPDGEFAEPEPEGELVRWALANNGGATEGPSEDAFVFCLERRKWQHVLVRAVEKSGGDVALTDDQLLSLAGEVPRTTEHVHLVAALRDRGLSDEAADLLAEQFEGDLQRYYPPRHLRLADDLGLGVDYQGLLRSSLNRWRPEHGVDTLEELVDLGRNEGFTIEVLSAIERWVRRSDVEGPPERQQLVSRAVEAVLRDDDLGDEGGLALYRRYLRSTDAVQGIAPSLFEAALDAGAHEVRDEIRSAYEVPAAPEEATLTSEAVLAARVNEAEGRWEDAYRYWRHIIDADSDPDIEHLRNAIENRIEARRLDEAEQLIDRLGEMVDSEAEPVAYRVHAEAAGDFGEGSFDFRRVVDLVERTEGLSDLHDALYGKVVEAYVRALANMGRWTEIHSFFDTAEGVDSDLVRFYYRIATLMEFAEGERKLDGTDAADRTEQLLTAPLTTGRLRFVLNVGLVGKLRDEIQRSHSEATDRMDVLEGLVEILIALHAERLIDCLAEQGVATNEYEERLSDIDARSGGRQLLATLEREARHNGIPIPEIDGRN